ncbi:MAG: TonB-dependent receptor [Pseudomonadales bacterium]
MRYKIPGLAINPITRAVAIATAASMASFSAFSQNNSNSPVALEEVLVTATKREVNLQDVPQSIQAFNNEQIKKLGFSNIQDYQKAIPSMATVSTSPGRSEVVFRGVSTGTGEWRVDSGSAVYLGEIPMTSATQSVDPRLVDIERVEALPGPQGTLFGSSSQSGALRILPNRPDHSGAYGSVDVGATYMKEGEPGYKLEGWVNIPLIQDKLTMRAVLFDSKTGGYIDNVYGTNIFTSDDNADVVEDDFNDWSQTGGRLAVLWSINDDWDAELMYMKQKQTSEGDPKSDPNTEGLGDLEIVRFHKDERTDDWWTAGLTIKGDLGFAELTLATGYLDREIYYEFDSNTEGQIRAQRVQDGYFGGFYYSVWYDTSFHGETAVNDQTAERFTQEIRLASMGESRLQWMVGAFYEETDDWWDYSFARVEDLPDTTFGQYIFYWYDYPESDDWFAEEYKATTKQIAVFGELNYAITDELLVTAGARWFEYDRQREEQKFWPRGNEYDKDIYDGKDDDTLYKLAVNYNISDDKMIYALYSEGFRLGGSNSIKNPSSRLPTSYGPDSLVNYEAGLKSQWLDNSLQLNISIYYMEWEDIQRGITDPDDWAANGTVNMGDATIQGFEATFSYQATSNLRFDASYAKSDSELKNDYYYSDIIDVEPGSGEDEQLGAKGQELAIAPPTKWWVGVEYNVPGIFGAVDGWIRYDHSWQEEMYHDWWNAMNAETGYGGKKLIGDASEGSLKLGLISQDSWRLTLSIWNIWDDRNAQWVDSSSDGDFGETGTWPEVGRYVNMPGYNRPREIEVSFSKDFSW